MKKKLNRAHVDSLILAFILIFLIFAQLLMLVSSFSLEAHDPKCGNGPENLLKTECTPFLPTIHLIMTDSCTENWTNWKSAEEQHLLVLNKNRKFTDLPPDTILLSTHSRQILCRASGVRCYKLNISGFFQDKLIANLHNKDGML